MSTGPVLRAGIDAVQAAASEVRLGPRPAGKTGDIEDAVSVLLHFSSGALGTIVVAWTDDDLPGRRTVRVQA